jgi:hypothetical protein
MHYYTSTEQSSNPTAGITPGSSENIAGGGGGGGFNISGGFEASPAIGDQYWEKTLQTVDTRPRAGVDIKRF